MVKLKWLKKWKGRNIGDVSNVAKKSAENFISQGYAEHIDEEKERELKIIAKKFGGEIKKEKARYLQDEATIEKNVQFIRDNENNPQHLKMALAMLNVLSKNYEAWIKEKARYLQDETTKKISISKLEFTQKDYQRIYKKIIKLLKEFMDLDKEYYSLIALWIIGTYMHKQFPAYPYLYFNAMKGSGKTRILKIISNLSFNGKLAGSMGEAVMFRTAKDRTLCIDEFENIGSKEKGDLRLLLNSAYKKGVVVERLKKVKEDYVVEEFEVYCPIAIANIWGMENVLADRCITLILEKSAKTSITKLIENFEENPDFEEIKRELEGMKTISFQNIYREWNTFQKDSVTSGVSVSSGVNVISGCDTSDTDTTKIKLYKTINSTNLQGRELELFFPLYIVSHLVSQNTFKKTLEISEKIAKIRKESDREENKDVQLIEFVAGYVDTNFIGVSVLVNEFKAYIESEDKWLNSTWLGRGLRRLKLVKDSRRTGKIRQVQLNIEKAKEKLLMFKEPDEIDKTPIKPPEI